MFENNTSQELANRYLKDTAFSFINVQHSSTAFKTKEYIYNGKKQYTKQIAYVERDS